MVIPQPGEYRLTVFAPDQSGTIKVVIENGEHATVEARVSERELKEALGMDLPPEGAFAVAVGHLASKMPKRFGAVNYDGAPVGLVRRIEVVLTRYDPEAGRLPASGRKAAGVDRKTRFSYRVRQLDQDGRLIKKWGMTAPEDRLDDLLVIMHADVMDPLMLEGAEPNADLACPEGWEYVTLEQYEERIEEALEGASVD